MKKTPWDWGNEALYEICRKNPRHKSIPVIVGKIWIIGRTYSAAIERRPKKITKDDERYYVDRVAPMILDSDIDKWIRSVSSIQKITEENLEKVLSCHKNLTDLFREISGIEKRSLASKYLHFHAPNAFFIYDSIANKRASMEAPRKHLNYPPGYDKSYSAFCSKCLHIRDEVLAKNRRRPISPRDVDKYLLGLIES